jgi:hypothetical protein
MRVPGGANGTAYACRVCRSGPENPHVLKNATPPANPGALELDAWMRAVDAGPDASWFVQLDIQGIDGGVGSSYPQNEGALGAAFTTVQAVSSPTGVPGTLAVELVGRGTDCFDFDEVVLLEP